MDAFVRELTDVGMKGITKISAQSVVVTGGICHMPKGKAAVALFDWDHTRFSFDPNIVQDNILSDLIIIKCNFR